MITRIESIHRMTVSYLNGGREATATLTDNQGATIEISMSGKDWKEAVEDLYRETFDQEEWPETLKRKIEAMEG